MRFTGALVPAFAHDRSVAHDDTAYARIRCCRIEAALGELECAGHVMPISF
jgi:hypothetical protein